jgi:hypothetical protein
MMRLFGCEAVHAQKATVTVMAETLEEARAKLASGDYIDIDHHRHVSMEPDEGSWQDFGEYD